MNEVRKGSVGRKTGIAEHKPSFLQFCLFLMTIFWGTAHAATYYFHNDHLGTPQLLSDENGAVAWRGSYDSFGKADELVALVEQNLRFPGQYFDRESGLHYNYNRDYDSQTGRYVQSDPIGLGGGISTFSYSVGNPIRFIDIYGLNVSGHWGGFQVSRVSGAYLGLTPHIESGPNGNDLVDRIGYFNFEVSGTLKITVNCDETSDCGEQREWTIDAEVPVNNLAFSVPYDEPRFPVPGMAAAIWADKVLRVGQYVDEWKAMIEHGGRALLNSPTLICLGVSFLK